ncbi:MAG: hypothetical protein ACYTA5_20260 [Planctomycetota bacterium]
MRYLCIVAMLAFMVTPAMAQPVIGKVCFSDDFEAYPDNTRLRSAAPVWGFGSGPENRIQNDPQGDNAVRLKATSGSGKSSDALKIANFVACMQPECGKVNIMTFTLQSDLGHQLNVGNHLTVMLNNSSGAELARWFGWSHAVTPRFAGTIGPSVNITDGAVHNFAIVYDPASGLCEWYHNGGLQWSKVLAAGQVSERVYVQDIARCNRNSCQDWVWLDDIVVGTPPVVLSLDILPNDDPNLFTVNTQGKGRLPMAIGASACATDADIDPASISIAGVVFPVKVPKFEGDDLIVHVSRRELIIALGLEAETPGTEIDVTVDGALLDGTLFTATDSITLVARGD